MDSMKMPLVNVYYFDKLKIGREKLSYKNFDQKLTTFDFL